MEFKNFKAMTVEEIDSYIEELTAEFNKTKEEIQDRCTYLEDLDVEYLDCIEEKNKRISDNGRK